MMQDNTKKKIAFIAGAMLVPVLLGAVPVPVTAGVLAALFQRFKEIDKGEADDARQY